MIPVERSADALPTEDLSDAVPTGDLVAHVAAKLCHDFISPTGAIMSGLDLLNDPSAQDMRADAMSLIEASAKKLVALVNFARVAYGAATSAERFDKSELEALARGVFDHMRAELVWDVEPQTLDKPQARALLNLAQIGGASLPTGGVATLTARLDDGDLLLIADCKGPRARFKPEVAAGLRGERPGDGLAGLWIQAYWLWQVVTANQGLLACDTAEEQVIVTVRVPA